LDDPGGSHSDKDGDRGEGDGDGDCRDLQSVFQTSLQASRALMKFKAVWVLGWCFLKDTGPMDIDISIYSS